MKRFYDYFLAVVLLILGTTIGYGQDSLLITAPTAYPCIGGGFIPLGNIVIEELSTEDRAIPNTSGATDSIIFRITNPNRFEFEVPDNAVTVHTGSLSLADTRTYTTGASGDTLIFRYRLTGSTNGAVDRFTIQGVRVRAKGTTVGVAEIIRVGGNSSWPDIQVENNITFATLISVTTANQSINAGADQTRCFPESFNLSGSLNLTYPYADTVLWTTTGAGTFSNPNSRNTVYTPGAGDTIGGPVEIRFRLANNNCATTLEDVLFLNLSKRLSVEAGPSDTVCANGPFQLNGSSIQGTTSASSVWSGGAGTFSPNATSLSATYTPTASEVSGPSFFLYLTSTGSGCAPVQDSVRLFSNPKNRPTIQAGADQSLCRGATVALNATVSNLGVATLAWSKVPIVAGGSFTSTTITNPVYTPSTADYDTGFVRLVLSTVGGTCGIIRDTVQINFQALPVASLVCFDPDTTICAGQSISFQAFGGASYRFLVNNTLQGASATATNTFASTTLVNSDTVRVRVFSGPAGSGCENTSNFFRVRVNPVPSPPSWAPGTQNFANNAPPINLDSIGSPSPAGGSFSGTGVIGNFLFPSLVAPATSTAITYRVTANGCTSTPTAPVTFNFFDPNQPFTGLAANYCFNDLPDTIFASKSSIPSGQQFDSFGFLNGATFVAFDNVTDLGATVRAILRPNVLGSLANGGPGAKQIIFRTNLVALPSFKINNTIQTTRINANPVVTITNKLSGFICEGNFGDSITTSVSTTNPGTFTFSGAITPITGGGARYNTINDGIQPVFNMGARTARVIFTETSSTCSGSDSSIFTVDQLPPPPTLPVSDVLLCTGDPIPVFTAGIVSAGLPTGANPQIFWFRDSTSTATGVLAANSTSYPISGSVVLPSTDTIYLRQRTYGYCFGRLARIIVNINTPPVPNAGTPITVCEGQTIPIDGSLSNAPVGLTTTWSAVTATPGTFTDTASLNGVMYTPSLQDRDSGFVWVRLTTSDPDGPGGCPKQTSEVRHTINRVATLFAGNDTVICAGSPTILRPAITPTTLGGQWFPQFAGAFSSGAAVPTEQNFTPDSAVLSLTAPTNIRMVFRTDDPDNAGPCTAIEDTMFVRVNPRNRLNAGIDLVVCEALDTTAIISLDTSNIKAQFFGATGTPLIWRANGSHRGFQNAGGLPDSLYTLNSTRAVRYVADAADVQRGFVWLSLTALDPDGSEPCTAASDSIRVQINRRPRVFAGVDQTICSQDTAQLNAQLGGPPNVAGEWQLGVGTFIKQGPILNKRLYTDPFYIPASSEISATAVTTVTLRWSTNDTDGSGPCPIAEDELVLTINPRAVVSAGNVSDTICAGQLFTFSGSFGGGATSAEWLGGLGSFNPSRTTPTAVYTPAASEIPLTINNRSILFRLATNDPDGAGPCLADTVNKRLVINRIPIVAADSAGRDTLIICTGESVRLTGRLAGSAVSGGWKGGTGSYSGVGRIISPATQFVNYTPNLNDPNEFSPNQPRFITLVLGSNAFQPCDSVYDTVVVRVNPAPVVNAGADLVICAGDSTQLGGSLAGSTSAVVWKGGLGRFVPNRNDPNAWYIPDSTEIPIATSTTVITFQLYSDDPDGFDPVTGPCDSVFDVKTLTINRIRTVVADTTGRDTIVYCRGAEFRLAAGFSVPGTTVTWSGGTGTFTAPNVPFTSYIPGPGEGDTAQIVHIRLRVTTDDPDSISPTNNGPCVRVFDEVVLRIDPAVVINAGPNLRYCASQPIQLFGSIGGSATSATWSGGANTFNNANLLNAVYLPSTAELVQDTVFDLVLFADSLPGGTCPSKADTVQVSLFANPVLTITMPDTQFCNLPITIGGTLNAQIVGKNPVAPSASFVTGSGVTSASITGFTFNPTVATNGLKTITYAFTRLVSENSCFSDTTIQVVVHPQPRSALQWSGTCQGDTLLFSDLSQLDTAGQFTPNSIVGWAWDFDLGSIAQDSINGLPSDSSLVQNPSYFYRTPGVKRPSLTVVTNNGCFNRADSIFAIGARTKPDFTWRFVCPFDSTEYVDTLSATTGAGNITFRRWVFGNSTVLEGPNSSLSKVNHQYPGPGAYNTRLTLTTQFGCVDSIERTVNILASTSPTPLAPYVQDFDANNGFWVASGINNDWAYGQASNPAKQFQPKYPGDRYWMTSLDSIVYRNSQASFVNGPCVNFLNLEKPMLVFDYRSQTTDGQDGAVVQYSINGGISWILLGSLNSGVNWYNRRDLSGNPGSQLIGNFGWNGKNDWRTARHSLDVIKALPDSLQQKVRFRIFFGTDASSFSNDTTEGFAFDNVRIEDRTRVVLLEYFNGVNSPGSDQNNDVFTSIIENMRKDAVGTSYYISGNNDPINRRNPADPSARALFYGISSPNEVVFNGRGVFPLAVRDSIGEKRIELQSLIPPILKLDVVGLNANQATATVSVRLQANDTIPANARLYIGLIESVVYIPSIANPGTFRDFSWVLRKMVPSAAGVVLDPSFDAPGDTLLYTFTGSIDGGLVDNLARLGVVAYVQNIQTKEIEQAAIFRASDWNVIGFQDGLLQASEVQVYPNPVHDRLHVVLTEPADRPLQVSMYDMLGKVVASQILERESVRLDLSTTDLRGGMYLLKVEDERGVVHITKKLLVQH
jgi:hypothetical protein